VGVVDLLIQEVGEVVLLIQEVGEVDQMEVMGSLFKE
jgi:hypothetical protein